MKNNEVDRMLSKKKQKRSWEFSNSFVFVSAPLAFLQTTKRIEA